MTSQSSEKSVLRRPETGWSEARRLREKAAMRTCIPAVLDDETTRTDQPWPEGNIVRGED